MSNKKAILKKGILLLIIIVFLNSFSIFSTLLYSESTKVSILLEIGNPVMKVNNATSNIDLISTDTVPVIIQSRTLLPIRAVIEAIGGQIAWDEESRLVTIDVNGQNIKLSMLNPLYVEHLVYSGKNGGMVSLGLYEGSKTIMVNGKPDKNDVPAMIINDRTFMPLRFIAENAGCKVDWYDEKKEVFITYPDPSAIAVTTFTPTPVPTTVIPTINSTTVPTTAPTTAPTSVPTPMPTDTVTPTPNNNQPPEVYAGEDKNLTVSEGTTTININETVSLDEATATDDGNPNQTLGITWSLTSGPGSVVFNPSNTSLNPTVTLSGGTGDYVIRLTANDGEKTGYDEVVISIIENVEVNGPNSVNAVGGRWGVQIINKDPLDDGPDGVTIADFNEDGIPDILVPFEEGDYSRLYFHPGYDKVKEGFDYITIPEGGEDAGAGDVDMDGHVDIVIDGQQVFFNPGTDNAMDPNKWEHMVLSTDEGRWPLVLDLDGDNHNDLLAAGGTLWKAPETGKRNADNWTKYTLSSVEWPMNVIPYDVDKDGDTDLVIAERKGGGLIYLEHPDSNPLSAWEKKTIGPGFGECLFMGMSDIDNDGLDDFIVGYGDSNTVIHRRTNDTGHPEVETIVISYENGALVKGTNIWDYDEDDKKEIFNITRNPDDEWMAQYKNAPLNEAEWNAGLASLGIPGNGSRNKMDQAIHCDVDGDGDMDVITTEENGGWGVIWFENPLYLNQEGSNPLPIDYSEPSFTKLLP